jgi:anti-sigma B factor antagonist
MPTSRHLIDIDLAMDDQGRKVFVARGDIDLQTAPVLRRRIERAAEPGETVVIDLRQVRYIDSPGLGTLVHCDRVQRELGGHLVMKDPSGPVRELFEVVGLANVIAIEWDQADDPNS